MRQHMARLQRQGGYHSDGTSVGARNRRARLTAEFESDLGIDHAARRRAAEDAARWIRIKTGIVWGIALIFFTIATMQLFVLREEVDQPFSGAATAIDWIDLPDAPAPEPPPPPIWDK
jgi:hypothetical protein